MGAAGFVRSRVPSDATSEHRVRPNLIAGEWVGSVSFITGINPSNTDDVVGKFAMATQGDVERAIDAAASALQSWSNTTPQERSDRLDLIAAEFVARRAELARELSREEGKTVPEAIAEVTKAAHVFRFFAGEAVRSSGEHVSSVRTSIDVDVSRRPVGVVGLITPWNFPLSIPAWKAAPALAYGNVVLLKPSELTCAIAWSLAEILNRHLPKGVFQLLMGDSAVGATLCSHPAVDAVSFTGSAHTGAKIAASVHKRGARLQMEMGGKNPLIVMEDANLELAIKHAIAGAFYSTGQRCTASSRLIVASAIHDRFVEELVNAMRRLRVGHALVPETDIGPMINDAQLRRTLGYIDVGRREGAELRVGGERLERETPGFFVSPALFTGTTSSQRINQEEIFGPVAAVIEVDSIDEAIAVANDTPYGLCAGLITNSLAYVAKFRKEIRSGMAMINLPTVGTDYHVPFGGAGASAYGPKELGTQAREFFTTQKTIYTAF